MKDATGRMLAAISSFKGIFSKQTMSLKNAIVTVQLPLKLCLRPQIYFAGLLVRHFLVSSVLSFKGSLGKPSPVLVVLANSNDTGPSMSMVSVGDKGLGSGME